MNKTTTENGQVLVFLVLAMVALLGFTALAVDGGNAFMVRRQAQNAADSAAMAATLAKSKNQDWQAAGYAVAQQNGFVNDDKNEVAVYNPPQVGLYAPPFSGAINYVQVIITTTLETSFAHLVYSGELVNTILATARYRPPSSIFPGNALHATNESACGAVTFDGNSTINIHGGNVFSNSTASGTPTSCTSGIVNGSAGYISVTGGGINVAGTWRNNAGATIDSELGINQGQDQQPLPEVPVPTCDGLPTRTVPGGSDKVLDPGRYPNGIKVTANNTNVTLNPGMYCLEDDFSVNGGTVTGEHVFIYMKQGAFDLGGNTTVTLTYSPNLTDANGNQWGGMLLYMAPDNYNLVKITGNSGSSYTGTIYASSPAQPASQPKCTLSGTGDSLAVNSQVICNTVSVTGNAYLLIQYNEEENYALPPIIELVQ
jgi:Flp pilus assembly protein TadG